MKIKLTEGQYKKLLKEFTELMVMCTPWKRCMDDPYGEDPKTKWFVGRLEYSDGAEEWFPYSQDSGNYKTRDEATQAYFDGLYGKEPLMEMRFDGKSTGLFADEEPKEDPHTGEDLIEAKKKKGGRPKAERSKSGRSIPGKYLTKNKSAMKKEIDTYAGKDTYKTKWDADYKSGKGGQGERYKTKESPATKAYRRMYGESNELDEAKKGKSSTDDTLSKKAKASGISKTILKQVHSRGMAAWNSGHRPGTPQNAWAMGRVNSFITGSGGARKADSDLWAKAKKSKAKKKKSKKNESVNINRMVITENRTIVSEGLRYHLDNQIPLVENVYRYGSESYFNLINEVRNLYNKGKVDLSFMDEELIKTDIGKKTIFEGKEVWLDIPMEDNEILTEAKFRGKTVKTSSPQRDSSGGKAYKVYVSGCSAKTKSNPSGVKQIRFGSGGLKAKLSDPDRRKAFDSRHGCSKGRHNDKCKAGYWSCRLPRYAKKLGLSGGGTWW